MISCFSEMDAEGTGGVVGLVTDEHCEVEVGDVKTKSGTHTANRLRIQFDVRWQKWHEVGVKLEKSFA